MISRTYMRVMHRIRWTTAYWFQAQNIGRLKTVAHYGLSADYIGFSERESARPDVTAPVKNKPHLPTLEITPVSSTRADLVSDNVTRTD
jgi:hypothetical protein